LDVQDLDQEDENANVSFKIFTITDDQKITQIPFWDYHISDILRNRVTDPSLVHLSEKMYVFQNAVCLQTQRIEHSTMQDVLDAYWKAEENLSEVVVIFYAIELIRVLETLRKAEVIHGNISPSNVVIRNDPCDNWDEWREDRSGGWSGKGVAVCDWSSAVDVKSFTTAHRFTNSLYSIDMPCAASTLEALNTAGWSYEMDKFCVASILHIMMNGPSSKLNAKSFTIPSGWSQEVWSCVLSTLLSPKPVKLSEVRNMLESFLNEDVERKKSIKVLLCKQNILVL